MSDSDDSTLIGVIKVFTFAAIAGAIVFWLYGWGTGPSDDEITTIQLRSIR